VTHPPISCMCLTFARSQRLVEEAVYSFLSQDYEGDKELLLLNDFDRQRIVFDHPQVTVVNVPARFHTVGEKRNAAAALCRYDLLAVWDDDDIYLPHRLTFSMQRYEERKRFFRPSKAFVLNHGVITGPTANLFHGGSIWHRSLFDQVGGYAHMGSGQDRDLEARFKLLLGSDIQYQAIQPSEIYYVYRWLGTGSYHLSAFGRDGKGKSGNEKVMDCALRDLSRGNIGAGEIILKPHWSLDYQRLVREHLATLK
jgi:Glycosyl transferase family 2